MASGIDILAGREPATLRTMMTIRRFDELTIQLRDQSDVYGTMHPYFGQEAVATGVCSTLRPDDRIVSNHRGHGHAIAKGTNVTAMMAELFGRIDGTCRGRGGSMHISDFGAGMLGANGIVGAGMAIGIGSALASGMTDSDVVTVAFVGDGATGQGVFYESLNLAAVWRLPIVFVCENNQYAVKTPISEALVATEVADVARGFGLPSTTTDGNDVEMVSQAAADAVDTARRGDGPSFLEFRTFRQGFHSYRYAKSPDDRPAEEHAYWRERDPITRYSAVLVERGLMTEDEVRTMRAEVGAELDAAVATARRSAFPVPTTAMEDVYA